MGSAVQTFNARSSVPVSHQSQDLVRLFELCFASEFNTRLIAGGVEPEYLPADIEPPYARIVFTQDYFASALHEVAHWCVAGPQRRQQRDYGYWYAPDGRTAEQQAEFERVEVKPQALEWLFAEAAGFKFQVSADNLSQGIGASTGFKEAIAAQARSYLTSGLPKRAGRFVRALTEFYGTQMDETGVSRFCVTRL